MADKFIISCTIGDTTTTLDLTEGIIDLNINNEINYYYEIETMDGKKHSKIRSVFTTYDVTIGDKLYPSSNQTYVEKFNDFYKAYMNRGMFDGELNVLYGDPDARPSRTRQGILEADTQSIKRMINSKFYFDTRSFTVKVSQSGVI